MTCPESITRDGETRHCVRTGDHHEHYTGFPTVCTRRPSGQPRLAADRLAQMGWPRDEIDRVVCSELDVYTWCAPVPDHPRRYQ